MHDGMKNNGYLVGFAVGVSADHCQVSDANSITVLLFNPTVHKQPIITARIVPIQRLYVRRYAAPLTITVWDVTGN